MEGIVDDDDRNSIRVSFIPDVNTEHMSDRQLWEYIVYRVFPDGDAFAAADWIFEKYKNLGLALHECERLANPTPVMQRICQELRIMLEVCCRVSRARLAKRPAMKCHSEIVEYCKIRMAHLPREQFRLLCFNSRYHLIADEVQQIGTVNHVAAYPREIARRALELGASAIVLVHNHPSGDPTPSNNDIQMTRSIVHCLKPLGIEVLDHIIVAPEICASFRRLGLFSETSLELLAN